MCPTNATDVSDMTRLQIMLRLTGSASDSCAMHSPRNPNSSASPTTHYSSKLNFTQIPTARLHTKKMLPVELRKERVATARPGRRMRRVCTGTLVHHEQTVRQRV